MSQGFKQKNNPTMNDVAAAADVSLKTVSRFVNGETNISPKLASRIEQAISGLGYRRNLVAASMRPGWTSKIIGLVISDLANPYYSALAGAVEEIIAPHGYMLQVSSSSDDQSRHDKILDRLLEQRVDGILVVPPATQDYTQLLESSPGTPLVFLDRPCDIPGTDYVIVDNFQGGFEATSALISAGAKNIVYMGDSLEIYTMRERYRGYLTALERHNLPVDPTMGFFKIFSSEDAKKATLQLHKTSKVGGIFAANNRVTIGVLQAFKEHSFRIPLVGFDDFEAAYITEPGTSVIRQDTKKMGQKGAEILLSQIDKSSTNSKIIVSKGGSVTLPIELILRGSELPSVSF